MSELDEAAAEQHEWDRRANAEILGERLRETADASAAEAEAEEAAEAEAETEAEETEAIADPLVSALAEYFGKAREILGDDFELKPCRFCAGLGFNAIERLPDMHSHPCEHCGGWGEVATGSKVDGNEARMCQECRGAGYVAETTVAEQVKGINRPEEVHFLSEQEIAEIQRNAAATAGLNAS